MASDIEKALADLSDLVAKYRGALKPEEPAVEPGKPLDAVTRKALEAGRRYRAAEAAIAWVLRNALSRIRSVLGV
jgi:hypothetical protein